MENSKLNKSYRESIAFFERRSHARTKGRFNDAEDKAYTLLRKIKPDPAEERAERSEVLRKLSEEV